jgi:hypothetical protein
VFDIVSMKLFVRLAGPDGWLLDCAAEAHPSH